MRTKLQRPVGWGLMMMDSLKLWGAKRGWAKVPGGNYGVEPSGKIYHTTPEGERVYHGHMHPGYHRACGSCAERGLDNQVHFFCNKGVWGRMGLWKLLMLKLGHCKEWVAAYREDQ